MALLILIIGGFALKVYWDITQDAKDRRTAYIRELEYKNKKEIK